jgi:hypothetical protein
MTTNAPALAAEVARAMSECMNLLFLFAAPRVLASVHGSGVDGLDGDSALTSLRRFLGQAAQIRARGTAKPEDVDRLVRAAMLVEEIAGALGTTSLDRPLPAGVVDRARQALAILGAPSPPGGWDAFEGFSVPYPPPPPER